MWRAALAGRWRRVRRARLLTGVAAGSLLVFGALALLLRQAAGSALDLAVTRAIQGVSSPPMDALMWAISVPGWWPLETVGVPLAALGFFAARFRREALFVLLTAGSGFISNRVKVLVERPRPPADAVHVFSHLKDFSYPSGHVVAYVSVFGFLFFLIYVLFRRSLWRTLALWVLGFFIATVGLSRVYLGQHWASDVLGGYALGSAYLFGLIVMYRLSGPAAETEEPQDAGAAEPRRDDELARTRA
jgi:undecaprenyl-diphosphatase